MLKDGLLSELKGTEDFFARSTKCLVEGDSEFRPQESMLTVAQHVAHVAQSVDWFIEGMTSEKGFSMDFDSHWVEVEKIASLEAAREWLKRSFVSAREAVAAMSEEQLFAPFPPGPVMGGDPRLAAISGISDHTAHHRGALTVYSRLLGHVPTMPYLDDPI